MSILFYDTETTGMPLWSEPSHLKAQPHIVQLAAVLTDDEGEPGETLDKIIRPDGWAIPDEMAAFHGITTERALDEGEPVEDVLLAFLGMWEDGPMRVGFNEGFDARMIRIAMKQLGDGWPHDEWKAGKKNAFCCMFKSRKICNVPNPGKAGNKNPTLEEAHQHFTGKPHEDAHTAMGDTLAAKTVYFAIRAHGGDQP